MTANVWIWECVSLCNFLAFCVTCSLYNFEHYGVYRLLQTLCLAGPYLWGSRLAWVCRIPCLLLGDCLILVLFRWWHLCYNLLFLLFTYYTTKCRTSVLYLAFCQLLNPVGRCDIIVAVIVVIVVVIVLFAVSRCRRTILKVIRILTWFHLKHGFEYFAEGRLWNISVSTLFT